MKINTNNLAKTFLALLAASFLTATVQADTKIAKRGLEHLEQSHIVQPVGEQPADQEFEGEIVNPLATGVVALLVRRHPAVDDAVAQCQRGGRVPIVLRRHAGVLADREPELGKNGAFDFCHRQFVDGQVGWRGRVEGWIWHFEPATVSPSGILWQNDTPLPPRSEICPSPPRATHA